MQGSSVSQLRDTLYQTGIDRHDRAVILAAYAVAGRLGLSPRSGNATWMAQLADRLPRSAAATALHHAKKWLLEDLGLPEMPKRVVDNFWYANPASTAGFELGHQGVAAILEEVLDPDIAGVPFQVARQFAAMLEPPGDAPCTCLFAASASVAWHLADKRIVSLWPGDHRLALTLSLLAFAFQKNLHVVYRNPLDGSFMPIVDEVTQIDQDTAVPKAEHIIAFPPFGMRTDPKSGRPLQIEALQLERFSRLASESYSCVVGDGLLFRENRAEAELRAALLADYSISVTSLPMGVWGRSMNVASSLLQLRPGRDDAVTFRNARDLPKGTLVSGRTEAMMAQLQRIARDELPSEQQAMVPRQTVLEANSVLLPSRYVRSASERAMEDALADLPTIALEHVASIERNKAPVPSKGSPADGDIIVLEVTPSDIADGEVRLPAKEVRFAADDHKRVASITVQTGDIVVSIKGAVGIVGKVGLDATVYQAMSQPWVISQSLAIVRFRKNNAIPSADVLAAILTAPWVRERLVSLSGGSVVNTLPISALRSLQIPVPEQGQASQIKNELEHIQAMKQSLSDIRRNLDERQKGLWEQLWNMKHVS
jgi:hypothetical protein